MAPVVPKQRIPTEDEVMDDGERAAKKSPDKEENEEEDNKEEASSKPKLMMTKKKINPLKPNQPMQKVGAMKQDPNAEIVPMKLPDRTDPQQKLELKADPKGSA